MLELKCDVHTHTLYTGHAYSTVLENAQVASQRGLELLGITDHFSRMINTTYDMRDFQYFLNLDIWPRQYLGVHLLHGCEADIVDVEGNLFGHDIDVSENIVGFGYDSAHSLQDLVFAQCDYVIASVHNRHLFDSASKLETTNMYIDAMDKEKVLIMGHMGRSGVSFDIDAVIEAAAAKNKLIEINNCSLGYGICTDVCQEIAEKCAEANVSIAVSTDAHIATEVGYFGHVRPMLEAIGFPEELIATRSKDAFLDAIQKGLGA